MFGIFVFYIVIILGAISIFFLGIRLNRYHNHFHNSTSVTNDEAIKIRNDLYWSAIYMFIVSILIFITNTIDFIKILCK